MNPGEVRTLPRGPKPPTTRLDPSDARVRQVGANILRLGSVPDPPFVMRRLEQATAVSRVIWHREVELHLDLTAFGDATQWPRLDGYLLVPLARFGRTPMAIDGKRTHRHTAFELVNESGARLPRLTFDEERCLVLAGVLHAARTLLGSEPSAQLREVLKAIVYDREAIASLTAHGKAPGRALAQVPYFMALLKDAFDFFYLVAPLELPTARRRVLAFTFQAPVQQEPPEGFVERVLKPLVSPDPRYHFSTELPGVGFCHSFHFTVHAPEDLRIVKGSAELVVTTINVDRYRDDDVSESSAHVHCRTDEPVASANFSAVISPRNSGVVLALLGVTLASAFLVLVGLAFVLFADTKAQNSVDRSALISLFLLGPGVVTTALALRTKNSLASQLLYHPKITAVGACVALYVGLIGSIEQPTNPGVAHFAWFAAFLAIVLCLTRLAFEQGRIRTEG